MVAQLYLVFPNIYKKSEASCFIPQYFCTIKQSFLICSIRKDNSSDFCGIRILENNCTFILSPYISYNKFKMCFKRYFLLSSTVDRAPICVIPQSVFSLRKTFEYTQPAPANPCPFQLSDLPLANLSVFQFSAHGLQFHSFRKTEIPFLIGNKMRIFRKQFGNLT